MKTKTVPKIHAVFEFFLKEGFQHTVEEIAEAVKVTPKTLFNRYKTKANMELAARRYWHQQVRRRLMGKADYCNNAIEKLVLLLCECKYCLHQETHYFLKEKELFFTFGENAFYQCLNYFLTEGRERRLLNDVVNQEAYAEFFMHNVFSFFPQHLNQDAFFHLLSPVFVPESQVLFNQIDINQIIHQ